MALLPFLLLIPLLPLPGQSTWSSFNNTALLQGLKTVHLVFRHGDRTPIDPYPNDPWKDPSHWPVGFGQLTSEGKLEQFKLGQWIRSRYQGFLSKDYKEEEVYVRSTDVDRTLMSASANLAGLFPPEGYQKFNPDLDWQPVPIHTVPQKEDSLLSSHADCPRFDELQLQVENSQFMKNIYIENRDLFEYISSNVGYNITDIVNLEYIYDTLLVETIHNYTLPPWTSKVFPGGKFDQLRDLSFTVDTFNDELKRLKGGPFLQEFIDHVNLVQGGSNTEKETAPYKKLYMYSGHDTTVAPILHTMGVFDGIAPPYTAMVILELFDRSGLFVRVSYKNTTDTAYVLNIPGCEELCPFEKFKDLTASMRPVDWRAECGLPSFTDPVVQRVTLVAAVVASVMAFTVLVATVAMLWRGKKADSTSSGRYQPVDTTEDY